MAFLGTLSEDMAKAEYFIQHAAAWLIGATFASDEALPDLTPESPIVGEAAAVAVKFAAMDDVPIVHPGTVAEDTLALAHKIMGTEPAAKPEEPVNEPVAPLQAAPELIPEPANDPAPTPLEQAATAGTDDPAPEPAPIPVSVVGETPPAP